MKTPKEEMEDAKASFWVLMIFASLASYWMWSDLSALEAGTVDSVKVWAPVAGLYSFFGFWPACLLLPILTLIGASGYLKRYLRAKSFLEKENQNN